MTSTSTDRYDVVVIGGGHNGLTAAALLAKQGRKVLVLERHRRVGGLAVGDEFHPGYRSAGLLHDTSMIRHDVVESLDLKRFGLALTPRPPAVFAPQAGGPGLLLHYDPASAAREINALSTRDAQRYAEYRAFFSRTRRFTSRVFHEAPPEVMSNGRGGMFQLVQDGMALRRLGRRDMMELLRSAPMCVADWLNEWFETDLPKCILAAPALHGGFAGPWSPGTSANLVRWEATAGQAAVAGPHALVHALEAAAGSFGVEIRTDAEVQRIRLSGGRVKGVILTNGETMDASVVASSCDPKQTFLKLLTGRDTTPKLQHRIENLRIQGTTAKVNLALNAPLRFDCRPDLEVEYARTGETFDEMERAFDAVKYRRFSERPILDIYIPTVANPHFAPKGHSVASIVVHFAPYDLEGGWNDEQRERLGDAVVDALARYAPDVKGSLVARQVLTPADIEARYGATRGHIHHGDHALDQLLTRPCPECARYATPIEGLYLCGSGSHPGGGLTCAPGALAAAAILESRL